MNKEINHTIRVGLFVVTGVLMLIVGLYFIGSNKNLFGSTFRCYTSFREVSGLQDGNNVRYSGIDVGTVNNIEIVNDTTILVEMVLEKKSAAFIRRNSVATVGTDGLMGNKLVNLEPGTMDSPIIRENDTLPSREGINTEAMLRTLDLTNRNIAAVSDNVKTITANINQSKGTLYTVLMDTSLASGIRQTVFDIQSVGRNLSGITAQLADLVSEVRQGKGTVGALLKDTAMKNNLDAIVQDVKVSANRFTTLTNDLSILVNKMNSGTGPVAALVNDTAMANSMKQSMLNIQSASKKLEENLEAMKHSTFLRGYFKKQDKEAEKPKKKENEKK